MPKLRLISCAVVVAAIFYLSNQPASQSGAMSLVLTEKILLLVEKILPATDLTAEDIHNTFRKTAHFFIFMLLGLLMMSLVKSMKIGSLTAAFIAFGICIGFALLDETHQFFIEGRSAEMRDVWIDSAGALVGIGLFLMMERILNSLFQQKEKIDLQLNK